MDTQSTEQDLYDSDQIAERRLIAERTAAEDRELLAALKAKAAAAGAVVHPDVATEIVEGLDIPEPKMNRADRRRQVALYAMVLAGTERQTPIVNPTIIPRATRRHRRHHAHH